MFKAGTCDIDKLDDTGWGDWLRKEIDKDIIEHLIKEAKMKDFLGNELFVGDEVVFMDVKCKTMKKGIIYKISEKKVTINYKLKMGKIYKTWRYGEQVVKIPVDKIADQCYTL